MVKEEYYKTAFARNLGLISAEEQKRLEGSKAAIAGMGGVGGIHLITLARIGVGKFAIADPDIYELANINRQHGAHAGTFGQNKAEAMRDIVKAINPFAEVEVFKSLDETNSDEFLKGADVFLDGIDFFSIDIRRHIFSRAMSSGIPAITSAPLGYSSTLHVFTKSSMTFDQYFDMHDTMTYMDSLISFAVGLAPKATHLKYMKLNFVSLQERTGPSLAIACNLCSAIAATEAVKVMLGKSTVKGAPFYFQFDPFRQVYKKGYMPGGNRNPIQRLKRRWLKGKLASYGIDLKR